MLLLFSISAAGTISDISLEAVVTSKCLLRIVQHNHGNASCLQYFHETMVPYLFRIVVPVATQRDDEVTMGNVSKYYEEMLRCIASVVKNVAQVLDFRLV